MTPTPPAASLRSSPFLAASLAADCPGSPPAVPLLAPPAPAAGTSSPTPRDGRDTDSDPQSPVALWARGLRQPLRDPRPAAPTSPSQRGESALREASRSLALNAVARDLEQALLENCRLRARQEALEEKMDDLRERLHASQRQVGVLSEEKRLAEAEWARFEHLALARGAEARAARVECDRMADRVDALSDAVHSLGRGAKRPSAANLEDVRAAREPRWRRGSDADSLLMCDESGLHL